MKKMKVCIIGCGTYGSYLLKRLLEMPGEKPDITVIEIGNEHTESEAAIGLASVSENSHVASAGRYFGLGGTSARWGGQILFFDERDNPLHDPLWDDIIHVNCLYREKVIANLLGPGYRHDAESTPFKEGIWLKYGRRNLFRHLSARQRAQVQIRKGMRVVELEMDGHEVTAVICKDAQGLRRKFEADLFYLTAGAIESCRLLQLLSIQNESLAKTDLGKNFGDHLSVELFRIYGVPPVINGTSLLPVMHRGSLLTTRMVVVHEATGRTGYVHAIFNREVKAFSLLKNLLFGKQKAKINAKEVFAGLGFLLRMGISIFLRKKFYAHKNNWSLQLDMEQAFPNNNSIELTRMEDRFHEPIVRINWQVTEEDRKVISDIREQVNVLLQANGIAAEPIYDPGLATEKVEDIYHPVGFIRAGDDEKAVVSRDNLVRGTSNLFHFSTAIFPSARSINPTAAVCCFIEQHLQHWEGRKQPKHKAGTEEKSTV